MNYEDFKKEVKPIADACMVTDSEIRDIYTDLELKRIREAGINGAKAGEDLRNIFIKLNHK